MGLNPDSPTPSNPASHIDDLAVYALNAIDSDEALSIEALLLSDQAAAALELDLRDAAGAYGAALTDINHDLPAALRSRVLAAAHSRREPSAIEAATAVEVHRIEGERAIMLLRRLSDEQMGLPVDPPEFAGWTIKDLAAHLASNEGSAVQVLGLDRPVLPETVLANEPRSELVLARHRALSHAETIDEFELCLRSVDEHVSALSPDDLEHDINWWGMDMPILNLLVVRSFETWTHADDIRRAVGLVPLPPPAPSLATMSAVAGSWTPLLVAHNGHDYTGQVVEIRLTGPGGAVHRVQMGTDQIDLTSIEPAAVVTLDIIDYCRAIGDRRDPRGVPYAATGDLDLAADFVGSLHMLATL